MSTETHKKEIRVLLNLNKLNNEKTKLTETKVEFKGVCNKHGPTEKHTRTHTLNITN